MPQIYLKDAFLRFSEHPILDHISLVIEPGERIAIVGRNGAGKSTLLRVLANQTSLDAGELILERNTHLAYFQQDNYPEISGPILDALIAQLDEASTGSHYWSIQNNIKKFLTELGIDLTANAQSLSGGQLRRAWLAFTLAQEAQVLLLDEPTNHLDLPTLQWLLQTLKQMSCTMILISHDRAFMQALCGRYIDIEHGKLSSYSGDYESFLKHREEAWAAQEIERKQAAKVLAQEEAWIRQGIKARRTRNEGRVRRLKSLREEAKARRTRLGSVELKQQQQQLTGKELMVITLCSVGYDDKTIIKPFDSVIFRGDKIALVGANGTGKTSLIKTLLGELPPLTGKIKKRHDLKISYFDQTKQLLDPEQTILDFVSHGRINIPVGEESIHINSYLNQFLFSYKEAQQKIKTLSGGQKNRVLLAHALSFACDCLVLDEPTNDLDIETLEVLENYLSESKTTLLFTSHDQYFINTVASTLWVIESDQNLLQFDGSYEDWQLYQKNKIKAERAAATTIKSNEPASKQPIKKKVTKLSYHEQRALELLPQEIEKLEEELSELQNDMADVDFFKQDADTIKSKQEQMETLQQQIDEKYASWEAITLKQSEL
jgi:ATP-binding cassette subfamily F protein uup